MGYTPHVLVIGGGIVGTAVARDLAIRGLDVTLVEQGRLTTGATGRMQGILYSGARQHDSELVASQFAHESETVREIAPHCVEETGGVLTGDPSTLDDLVAACEKRDIAVDVLGGDAIREHAPALAGDVDRAVAVPDAVVDPFRLTIATARSAAAHGADIRPHTEVTAVAVEDGTVETVEVSYDPPAESDPTEEESTGGTPLADGGDSEDLAASGDGPVHHVPGERGPEPSPPDELAETFEQLADESTETLEPDYVVNAAGAWAGDVAGLIDSDLPLSFEAGGMAVAQGRHAETVITRYGQDETETVVPYGENTVVGTVTSPASGPEDHPERDDIGSVVDAVSAVVPAIESTTLLRAFWGIRCWPSPASNRHRFALVDHGRRDDVWGMTSVVGGSLTIHRLVAEKVTDDVCEKFGIRRPCQTAEIPLPGGDDAEATTVSGGPSPRFGPGRRETTPDVSDSDDANPVVCESQSVTRAEIRDAIADETAVAGDLNEVRLRTGATMGSCQGGPCAHRLAAELYDGEDTDPPIAALEDLLAERWRGQRHTLGGRLSQVMENYVFHASTMNRKASPVALSGEETPETEPSGAETTVSIENFAGRPATERDRERPPWGERPL